VHQDADCHSSYGIEWIHQIKGVCCIETENISPFTDHNKRLKILNFFLLELIKRKEKNLLVGCDKKGRYPREERTQALVENRLVDALVLDNPAPRFGQVGGLRLLPRRHNDTIKAAK
jgi:hypothetical protein